ncbi:ArdC family protein [Ammoniphilus sp. 3BR4]|uniref:ArdC family protein n=1 Tax=Ammoniphilus sp. 3BR4 TaxID=3158265 RepID=UPI003464F38F
MSKVYEMVTTKIIQLLEQGVIPWRRPWTTRGAAVNWVTQKPYRGINTMLLDPGEYATFNQIKEVGGTVKKGAKSHLVVFWKWIEVENEETEEREKVPFLRYYNVFEINTQCEGLKSKQKIEAFDHDPISEAEKIKEGYRDCPKMFYKPGQAYYVPSLDVIQIPPLEDYKNSAEYYSTMFHEMVHSTGHYNRLNRPGIEKAVAFGSETYSKEELVAEIGAAMLCSVAGIDNSTIENSVAYIGSWLRKLKDDKKLIVQAAAQAQKAADYILGIDFSD